MKKRTENKKEKIKIEKEDLEKIKGLEKTLKYTFANKALAVEAITHKSYANEKKVKSNERLEFLGDSIIAYVITHELYFNKEVETEGDMTKMRAYIVCEDSFYEVAQELGFEKFIKVGKAQEHASGISKAILADMFEAIIAAVYCDSNLKQVKKLILRVLKNKTEFALESKHLEDYKTLLQENAQALGVKEIRYEIISQEGPDHNETFVSEVYCDNKALAQGEGKSKKESQTDAARKALIKYNVIKQEKQNKQNKQNNKKNKKKKK